MNVCPYRRYAVGATNVKTVYARWAHLPDGPFRLLVFMALTAKDEPAPRFWGGREALALALGRMVPDSNDTDEQITAERKRAFLAVKRALQALSVAGVVSTLVRPAPGRQAVYGLHLSIERGASTDPRTGVGRRPPSGPNGGRPVAKRGSVSARNGGHSVSRTGVTGRPPEEEEEDVGRKLGGNGDLDTAVTASRARPPHEQPESDPSNVAGPPALRIVQGNARPSPRVATNQPALWPALVTTTSEATMARTRRPAIPKALQPDAPATRDAPAPPVQGNGFCLPCYAGGQIVVATDPTNGSTCTTHERKAAAS